MKKIAVAKARVLAKHQGAVAFDAASQWGHAPGYVVFDMPSGRCISGPLCHPTEGEAWQETERLLRGGNPRACLVHKRAVNKEFATAIRDRESSRTVIERTIRVVVSVGVQGKVRVLTGEFKSGYRGISSQVRDNPELDEIDDRQSEGK